MSKIRPWCTKRIFGLTPVPISQTHVMGNAAAELVTFENLAPGFRRDLGPDGCNQVPRYCCAATFVRRA